MHALIRRFAPLLGAAAVLLLGAATAAAQSGEPKVHLPEGLAADEIVPVIVTEPGLAEDQAQLKNALNSVLKTIIIETAPVRDALRTPDGAVVVEDAVEAALAAGVKQHAAVAKCPWILLGFSAASNHFAALEWRAYGRFQGLALVNARVSRNTLQAIPAVAGRANHPVFVMHGSNDPVTPIAVAQQTAGLLRQLNLAVTFQSIETAEHMAPLGSLGAEHFGKWLDETFGTKPINRRAMAPTRITTATSDELTLTADLYDIGDTSKPIVCCFHQARSGRAEYRPIAPRLAAEGYNVLAIDQRSGAGWNGVRNATAAEAQAKGVVQQGRAASLQGYLSARADLDRAIAWARELKFTGPLVIIGSSYSSTLSIYVAAENSEVAAVVSCSPGDYLPPQGSMAEAGAKLHKPTLILCPPAEQRQAQAVLDLVASKDKELYVQPQGRHGASTFYTTPTSEQAWTKLLAFLKDATASKKSD
ncbi:MAG: alpha/beta fold hydrolase [Planctomycetota bacterium]|jgi:pimeloyl-ACP methyl ester carboxylesterase